MYDIVDAKREHFPAIKALFIKELSKGDIPAWSSEEDDYPICMLPEDEGHSLLMLDEDGNAVAYAAYHGEFEEVEELSWRCKGKPVYFHRLLVDRNQRGKGLARRMLEALVAKSKQLGYECYRFVVYPENKNAIAVYEKLGLNCLGEVKSPWEEYGDGGIVLLYEILI